MRVRLLVTGRYSGGIAGEKSDERLGHPTSVCRLSFLGYTRVAKADTMGRDAER